MISLSPYGFSVALHALILAAACWLAVIMIRRLKLRATAALIFIATIAVAPWIVLPAPGDPAGEMPVVRKVVSLPQWTVAKLPPEPGDGYIPTPPSPGPVSSAAKSHSPIATAAVTPARSFEWPSLQKLAATTWFAGSVTGVFFLMLNAYRMAMWVRRLRQPTTSQWQLLRVHLDSSMESSTFRISSGTRSPCVAGWLRPVIIIPDFLLGQGREQELRWSLAHEIRHWRDNDSRWIWAIVAVRILYWWNPFVHGLAGQWTTSREGICDLAAARESDRFAYGRFLVDMAGRAPERQPMTSAFVRSGQMRSLRARIVALLRSGPADLQGGSITFRWLTALGLFSGIAALSGLTIAEDTTPPGPASATPAIPIPIPVGGSATPSPEKDRDLLWSDDSSATIPHSSQEKESPPVAPDGLSSVTHFAVVYSREPLGDGNSVIRADHYEDLCDQLARDPSSVVAEVPVMANRNGLPSRFENRYEIGSPHPSDEGPVVAALGWKIVFTSSFEGNSTRLEAEANLGYVAGKFQPSPYLLKPGFPSPEDIRALASIKGKGNGLLEPGDLLLTSLGKIDSSYVTLVGATHTIDAAGRPTANLSWPKIPAPQNVRLSGIVATYDLSEDEKKALTEWREHKARVPDQAPLSHYFGDTTTGMPLTNHDLPYLSTQTLAGARFARKTARETKNLDPIVIPSGKVQHPWETLDLSVGAYLRPEFMKAHPAIQLQLPGEEQLYLSPIEPMIWVVELPAETEGTRRFAYLAAELSP